MSNKKQKKEGQLSGNSDAAVAARRAYQRQWRAKNPDKVKEYNRRLWERKAERLAAEKAAGNADK
jgi:hypothetical protein